MAINLLILKLQKYAGARLHQLSSAESARLLAPRRSM